MAVKVELALTAGWCVICLNRHRSWCLWVQSFVSLFEQIRRSWENWLEDEWFCCTWCVNTIIFNYLMREYIWYFKNRHLRWYGLDFKKEVGRMKAEAGWLHILTVQVFIPGGFQCQCRLHANCIGCCSLCDFSSHKNSCSIWREWHFLFELSDWTVANET